MKKRTLVTFFDSNYIHRAVITYESLAKVHKDFVLYAICFDDLSYEVVKTLNYENFIPVSMNEFETEEMKERKRSKTKMYEYYWSCKPYSVQWVMEKSGAEMVTYIDCDFMFFKSPEPIFQEADKANVIIQPNNFSFEEEDEFIPVGYYCSCWESFCNNSKGREVLTWWNAQCSEWCSSKFEDGKFADQKYLDGWRRKFVGVKEIVEVGANIAPWSATKYDFSEKDGSVWINDKYKMIYYHFHSFKMNLSDYKYVITGDRNNSYDISPELAIIVYQPYINKMKEVLERLKKIKNYRKYTEINPEGVYLLNQNK
jgi:hypothetical protein